MTGPDEPQRPPDPWERAPGQPASWERPPGQPAPWEAQAWGSGPQQPGYPAPYQPYPGYPRQTAGKATTVMVLGIVALATFFAFCGAGFVVAIVALAMAPGARREIEASGGALDGATQLRVGTIMAWVTVGLTVLGVVAVAIFIAIAANAPEGSGTLSSPNAAGAFDLRPSAG